MDQIEKENYQRVNKRQDSYSREVMVDEAWKIFDQIKNRYNAKTPRDIVDSFKSGNYIVDAELFTIMSIISDS